MRQAFFALLLVAAYHLSFAQTLTTLTNQPPDGAGIGFLLTDGTVMFQGNNNSDWWKLTPDKFGKYQDGTWTQVASLPSGYAPYAFASATLADGRVLIEGGEYNPIPIFAFTDLGAIYDPAKNTWTPVNPPAGWGFIGDSPSAVLPNGKFLLGRKFDRRMAELDPATLKWTEVSSTGKSDFFAEEGWTLLPNGSILTADVKNNPHTERYLPTLGKWISEGNTPVNLQGPPEVGCIQYGKGQLYCPPGEIGPAILRPDGTVFATGATHMGQSTGHTAIYHPGKSLTSPGTWTAGPDFPNDDAGDSYAALLPNGHVLVSGNSGTFYEFDGTKLIPKMCCDGSLLVLPTGQVIVNGSALYNPTGTYQAAWAPKVTSVPTTVAPGKTYKVSGQQFNGLSQAASFGDEFETNTNYPLVRITNRATHHVFYCKTHNHSTMAVATGTAPVYTFFDVPADIETGASTLQVVANGIPSTAVNITVSAGAASPTSF